MINNSWIFVCIKESIVSLQLHTDMIIYDHNIYQISDYNIIQIKIANLIKK